MKDNFIDIFLPRGTFWVLERWSGYYNHFFCKCIKDGFYAYLNGLICQITKKQKKIVERDRKRKYEKRDGLGNSWNTF